MAWGVSERRKLIKWENYQKIASKIRTIDILSRRTEQSTDLGWRGSPWRGTARGSSVPPRPLPGPAGAAAASSAPRSAGGERSGRAAPGWGGPWWSSRTACSSRHTTPGCTCCPASASAAEHKRGGCRCEMEFMFYGVLWSNSRELLFSQLHLFPLLKVWLQNSKAKKTQKYLFSKQEHRQWVDWRLMDNNCIFF